MGRPAGRHCKILSLFQRRPRLCLLLSHAVRLSERDQPTYPPHVHSSAASAAAAHSRVVVGDGPQITISYSFFF